MTIQPDPVKELILDACDKALKLKTPDPSKLPRHVLLTLLKTAALLYRGSAAQKSIEVDEEKFLVLCEWALTGKLPGVKEEDQPEEGDDEPEPDDEENEHDEDGRDDGRDDEHEPSGDSSPAMGGERQQETDEEGPQGGGRGPQGGQGGGRGKGGGGRGGKGSRKRRR